jgi:hypothetical protein
MMQFRELPFRTPVAARVTSVVSYPGAAAAVKLTADQKAKLIGGAAPAEVLTADQKSALAKMVGTPFKGAPLDGTRGVLGVLGSGYALPGFAPLSPLMRLAGIAGVEKALGLTPEQAKTFDAARTAYQTTLAAIPQQIGPDRTGEIIQQQAGARAAFDKATAGLLTPEQEKRLAQLVRQADAALSLLATLTMPATATALELTPEQTDRLTALNAEAVKLQRLRAMHISFIPNDTLGLRMREAADERMMAVLTAAQKAKWTDLTGDPLRGLQKTIPGGFGDPGFGGGGFGGPGRFGGNP